MLLRSSKTCTQTHEYLLSFGLSGQLLNAQNSCYIKSGLSWKSMPLTDIEDNCRHKVHLQCGHKLHLWRLSVSLSLSLFSPSRTCFIIELDFLKKIYWKVYKNCDWEISFRRGSIYSLQISLQLLVWTVNW